jgi:hypothetical protein
MIFGKICYTGFSLSAAWVIDIHLAKGGMDEPANHPDIISVLYGRPVIKITYKNKHSI